MKESKILPNCRRSRGRWLFLHEGDSLYISSRLMALYAGFSFPLHSASPPRFTLEHLVWPGQRHPVHAWFQARVKVAPNKLSISRISIGAATKARIWKLESARPSLTHRIRFREICTDEPPGGWMNARETSISADKASARLAWRESLSRLARPGPAAKASHWKIASSGTTRASLQTAYSSARWCNH